MKLIDWSCKKCGKPMPDNDFGEDYLYCPACGAKHRVDHDIYISTYQERAPWPQWVESETAGPITYTIKQVIY